MNAWPSPALMAWKAMRAVCTDDAQNRLTVVPGRVSRPSCTAMRRATFCPCSSCGSAHPRCRSVISARSSSGTWSSAAATIRAARSSGRRSTNEPLRARPSGESEVATMTASGMAVLLCLESEVAADEFLHDLVGAGPDPGHPGVHPSARHAVLGHVAVAAVQLHAGVDDVVLHVRAPPLGLGRVHGGQLAAGVRVGALVQERLR